MPRYLLIAGVDFGTSFTKVVLRDNNQPGSHAVVVTFPKFLDGLLPSHIGVAGSNLKPPAFAADGNHVPYPKMAAAHVASGQTFEEIPVQMPASLTSFRKGRTDCQVIRGLLAYYFANVMAATEAFVRASSPWQDFDFGSRKHEDFLVYQLAVPTGLLQESHATERLFREALIAAYELRAEIDPTMSRGVAFERWAACVEEVLKASWEQLEDRFKWQCLLYPEVAGAVQAVFRRPNAQDGLYVTMDVGAGTVDLNAFHRFTGQGLGQRRGGSTGQLNYYSAIVCPLGIHRLHDPHRCVRLQPESELMEELRSVLCDLHRRALVYQPNNGAPGNRTWDSATHFIFGGGAYHSGYRQAFAEGLRLAGIRAPQVYRLPAARDLRNPRGTEFGRFAVAYGLSFFRPSLDHVHLPRELTPFHELYPQSREKPPRAYGFDWED